MPKKRKPVEPDLDAFAEEHGDALADAMRNRQIVNPETGRVWTWRDIRRIAGAAGISPSEMNAMSLDEMTDFLEGQRAEEDRRRQRDADATALPDGAKGANGQDASFTPPLGGQTTRAKVAAVLNLTTATLRNWENRGRTPGGNPWPRGDRCGNAVYYQVTDVWPSILKEMPNRNPMSPEEAYSKIEKRREE